MTQSDDLAWHSNGADSYALETCLTDVQASRLVDEVFAAVEAEAASAVELDAVLEDDDSSPAAVLVPYEPLTTPHSVPTPERSRKLHINTDFSWGDRFLRGIGIASFILGVGLWIATGRQPTTAVAPETTTTSAADVAFAKYLQTSLQLLSQQPTPTPAATSAQAPQPQGDSPRAVERIYVPIYQPPTPAAVTIPQLPTITVPKAPPATTAPAKTPPRPVAAAPSSPAPPQHTLVGILELGDRSVALVQTNGQTLRLSVGDSLGSDGWQLVQIQNQRVVLRRQGEVRSLTVGQSF